MAEAWQTAFVEVVPSFRDFKSKANSEIVPALSAAGDRGGKAVSGGILGAVKGIGGPLLAAVAALGIGRLIGNSIGTGINFALDGIDLATDLAETESAVKQIFGEASDAVLSFSEDSAKNLGATRREVLEGIKTFGTFGKAAQLRGPELADFSSGLVTLATDLASFNNTSTNEAIGAIGAALRGESEPLRAYGVLLDDATLRNEAFKLGLIATTNQALTPQQKVLAAQAAIYKQTSDQQGDFARTSGGLAGQQKILAASFEEAKTKLGTALLPAMTTFATLANDKLIPILNTVVEQVGPVLADALVQSAPAFGELITAIAPLIPDLVRLAAEALPPFLDFLIAVSPMLIQWARTTADAQTNLTALSSFLKGDTSLQAFMAVVRSGTSDISKLSNAIISGLRSAQTAVLGFLRQISTNIALGIATIQSFPGKAVAALSNVGTLLLSSGRALIGGFIEGIRQMAKPVTDVIGGIMSQAAGFFPNSPAKYGAFSGSGWTKVGAAGAAIAEQFESGIPDMNVPLRPSVQIPNVSSRLSSVSSPDAAGAGGGSAIPIVTDGGVLFGWIKTIASGQARLEINRSYADSNIDIMSGGLAV